ncbi:MAG: hypothetical protein PWP46_1547 [Fusobacteriaceae bacterium]|jgi:twitching motility protein PilT|nr:twitching motility protein [Fusobacteriales bacterium]MDN5304661.1 hypothetical protein [Fusobacteriaceae bacterium]
MIDKYLKYLVENNGSDLHLRVGNTPIIRKNGDLINLDNCERLTKTDLEEIVDDILDEEAKEKFLSTRNYDVSYSVPGTGRFRLNISLSRSSYMIVARLIPFDIPSIEALHLPSVLKEIAKEKDGLILVTGATGSGKSTTVAALLEYINNNFRKNIITFEDPIEFLFKDKKCIISQKEVPNDIPDFSLALKYVLRQDPDIIYIGELRDKETIETALKAAETGHLVISTLHTVNATKTISRILDFFPADKHKQIRYQLSDNLKAVISQKLLKTVDNNKRAINEILRTTSTIQELIKTDEGTQKIPDIIKANKDMFGMQSFDQNIVDLYKRNIISYEVAHANATIKTDIEMLKSGITSDLSDFY